MIKNQSIAKRVQGIGGESAYTVMAKAKELEKEGKSIIHLEIGQPDFNTPNHIIDSAIASLKKGETKYTPAMGIPEFREVVAKYINKTRNVSIDKKDVVITPSGKMAIALAMMSVVDPGDEVIYPDPGFPIYENMTRLLEAVPKSLAIVESKSFSLDVEELKSKVNDKTKLVILNSPSNPTGGIISETDLKVIIKLAEEKGFYILSDEIYSRIVYDGVKFPSIYSLGSKDQIFLVDGFSKTYAMTGWRLGFLAFPHHLEPVMDNLAVNLFGCTPAFIQAAGISALEGNQDEPDKMVQEFEKRRDILVGGLNRIEGITCLKPGGSFYVFPNVEGVKMNTQEFAKLLLEKYGVALLTGNAFGHNASHYLRLSYANSIENIQTALQKIEKAVKDINSQ
ncbi:MAG: pyridoxal phosphate-dependent aminotransferase [bacterium]|nr:pyridoxal phosphate-dependent aminotransferase [bacterium]